MSTADYKEMTDQEWFALFDATNENFKWFWLKYGFKKRWDQLMQLRKMEQKSQMLAIMNTIWFLLPDNRFNIMVNPDGWKDFLRLIEE